MMFKLQETTRTSSNRLVRDLMAIWETIWTSNIHHKHQVMNINVMLTKTLSKLFKSNENEVNEESSTKMKVCFAKEKKKKHYKNSDKTLLHFSQMIS